MSFLEILLLLSVIGLMMGFVSFIKSPQVSHKALAIDFMTLISAAVMGIYAVFMDDQIYLDIVIVWALVNFLGAIAFSIYLSESEKDEEQKGGEL